MSKIQSWFPTQPAYIMGAKKTCLQWQPDRAITDAVQQPVWILQLHARNALSNKIALVCPCGVHDRPAAEDAAALGKQWHVCELVWTRHICLCNITTGFASVTNNSTNGNMISNVSSSLSPSVWSSRTFYSHHDKAPTDTATFLRSERYCNISATQTTSGP